MPGNLIDVATRQKEIQYSSRTRAGIDHFKHVQRVRGALANLLPRLPADLRNTEDVKLLEEIADHKVYNVIHLIYRARQCESHSKDYEFSRLTMNEHWSSGYDDAATTLKHPEIFERPANKEGVSVFDTLKKACGGPYNAKASE